MTYKNTGTCYDTGELWKQYAKWKKPDVKDHILYVYKMFQIGKSILRSLYCWEDEEKWKMTAIEYRVSFEGNEHVLKLIVLMVAQHCD
jgi:hypothetical protein